MIKKSDVHEVATLTEQLDNLDQAVKSIREEEHYRFGKETRLREVMYVDVFYYSDESGPSHLIPEKLEVSFTGLLALLAVQREQISKRLIELGVELEQ